MRQHALLMLSMASAAWRCILPTVLSYEQLNRLLALPLQVVCCAHARHGACSGWMLAKYIFEDTQRPFTRHDGRALAAHVTSCFAEQMEGGSCGRILLAQRMQPKAQSLSAEPTMVLCCKRVSASLAARHAVAPKDAATCSMTRTTPAPCF
jgi:hypothetical protein